jgi:hypothetical protein
MLNLNQVRGLVAQRFPTLAVGFQHQIADFCKGLYDQGYVAGEKAQARIREAPKKKPKAKRSVFGSAENEHG